MADQEKTHQFLIDLAEYVGANESFEMEDYYDLPWLADFIKPYGTTFRVWLDLTLDDFQDKIGVETPATDSNLMSTSLDLGAIREIIERIQEDTGELKDKAVVTKHEHVTGFEPIKILDKALYADMFPEDEESYVMDVIDDNEYQKEVLVLNREEDVFLRNVVAYWDAESQRLVKM